MSVSMYELYLFQLTLPVWGATARSLALFLLTLISTHAPRVGSDCLPGICLPARTLFQLTLPVWGATLQSVERVRQFVISTHAPRVGSDTRPTNAPTQAPYFNSRSPCGERHRASVWRTLLELFQLTLPVWGATGSTRLKH